jgi:hypothetical protein
MNFFDFFTGVDQGFQMCAKYSYEVCNHFKLEVRIRFGCEAGMPAGAWPVPAGVRHGKSS